MEYRNLGRTGVKVSPLCLGAMNFGGPTAEDESMQIIDRALEGGINFIDTANVYNAGESESIVGRALESKRQARPDRAGDQGARRRGRAGPTSAATRATTSSKPARIRCAACRPTTSTCTSSTAR